MAKYYLIVLTLILCSYQNDDMQIRYYSTSCDDSAIRGFNLNDFYNENLCLVVHTKNRIINDEVLSEWQMLQDSIKGSHIYNTKMGIYAYAIAYQGDTLYTDSPMQSWTNGEKNFFFPSKEIKLLLE